jgi:hypothetical protein
MFSQTIIDSDVFLDMPSSTQSLYFHLAMRADDEGFVNNPKKIMRAVRCAEDDFKILLAKRYILSFDSGIIVIKHWMIHNIIRPDRLKVTLYKEEKQLLEVKENGVYTELRTNAAKCPHRLDKVSIDKVRLEEDSIVPPPPKKDTKHKHGELKHVLLTDAEVEKLKDRFGDKFDYWIKVLDEGLDLKDYGYKSHYRAILKWSEKEFNKPKKGYVNPYTKILESGVFDE